MVSHSMVLCLREWFDKVNGNTYQSVKVFVDGETVAVLPLEYGHGDATALHRAWGVLGDAGFPVPSESGWVAWRESGWRVSVDCCPIARRKDAHHRSPGVKGVEVWSTFAEFAESVTP